jgi:hypothetical protein
MPTVTSVTKHWLSAKEGFTTTTSSGVSSGAATVLLNSVTGYTDGDSVAFVIDPTDTLKKQVFTGVIDVAGVRVTGVVWTEGTNQSHLSGATIVDYVTATHMAALAKGLLVIHNQAGTLKSATVPNAALVAGAVTPDKLNSTASTTWPMVSWVPTIDNVTTGNGTVVAKYVRTGNIINFFLTLTFGSTTAVTGTPNISLPFTAIDNGLGVGIAMPFGRGMNSWFAYDLSANSAFGGTFNIAMNESGGTFTKARVFNLTSIAPFTWATGDVFQITGYYEAAT